MRGITIDSKIDLLAAVAFLFSLIGALPQIYGWWKGSQLILLPPPQIEIFHKSDQMRVSTDMAYVNRGLAQYGSLVEEERVEFELQDPATGNALRKINFYWVAFLQTQEANDPANPRLIEEVESRVADAHPFVVHGGDGAAHHTAFFARQVQCDVPDCLHRNANFYSWTSFKKLLAQEGASTTIDFIFLVNHDAQGSLRQVCRIVLDQGVKKWLNSTIIPNDEIIQLPCLR